MSRLKEALESELKYLKDYHGSMDNQIAYAQGRAIELALEKAKLAKDIAEYEKVLEGIK